MFRQDNSKNGNKTEVLTLQEVKAKDLTASTCSFKAQLSTILVPVFTDLNHYQVAMHLQILKEGKSNTDKMLLMVKAQ